MRSRKGLNGTFGDSALIHEMGEILELMRERRKRGNGVNGVGLKGRWGCGGVVC